MKTNIEKIKQKILPILIQYGVTKAGLFGSSIRDDITPKSDIDILVELKKDISLLGFIKIKLELEQTLGKKVDLIEYSAIKPQLRNYILSEQVIIL
ncbi:MAG: nucleotidyltransferase family protein [bacterium]